jgi:hypothetical protein
MGRARCFIHSINGGETKSPESLFKSILDKIAEDPHADIALILPEPDKHL